MNSKKLLFFLIALFFSYFITNAQEDETDSFELPEIGHSNEGIGGNINLTAIDKEMFFGTRLTPDISIGKLGFGLDIPLLINLNDGKIRLDEYTDGIGPLRIIKYFRWGIKKRDNFYFRIGELRDAQLGFGMLLSDYKNSISFEKRKLGAEFDIVIKKQYGLELIYSDLNFSSFNLFAIRPYFKPFGSTEIPIIKTFEIGAGYVTDYDKTFLIKNDSLQLKNNYFLDKGINSFSADMGFYIFNWKFLRWTVYAQAGYMNKVKSDSLKRYINSINDVFINNYTNGMGWSIGSDFHFHILGNLLKINYRAERFWHSDYYIPRFYSFAYELNKDNHIKNLISAHQDKGMYMKLGISILDKIVLHSNIIFPDRINSLNRAEMYVGLDLSNLTDKLIFSTNLYQANISNIQNVFSLTDETLFETLIAWKVYELPVVRLQFIVGLDFKWTYALIQNKDFTAVPYYSPFFKINVPMKKDKEENKE